MSSRSLSFGGGSGASSAAQSAVQSPLSSGRISRHQTKLYSDGGGKLQLNEAALAAAVADAGVAAASAAGSPGQEGGTGTDRDEELLALEGQLGREEAQELQQLFSILDKDGGGNISQSEFSELLATMQVRPSPLEMDLMYGELDADNDGVVELREFLLFMTRPGVQSANGAALLQAFRHIEGFQYERGVNHPPDAGRSSKRGQLHLSDLSLAMRTYLPDKVRTDREATELLHCVKADKRTGMVDYHSFVRAHVKPETMPPMGEDGTYNIPHEPRKSRRHTTGVSMSDLSQLGAAEAAKAAAAAAAASEASVAAAAAAAAASSESYEAATRLLEVAPAAAKVLTPSSSPRSGSGSGGSGRIEVGGATAVALASMVAVHSSQATEREVLAACDPDGPVPAPPAPTPKRTTGKKKSTLGPKPTKAKQTPAKRS